MTATRVGRLGSASHPTPGHKASAFVHEAALGTLFLDLPIVATVTTRAAFSSLAGGAVAITLIGFRMVVLRGSVMRCQTDPMWVPENSVDRLRGATGKPGCRLSLAGPR